MRYKEIAITTRINKEYIIRVTDKTGTSYLVGAGQLHKWVGQENANKLFSDALISELDVFTRKLRRGLKIDFHSK